MNEQNIMENNEVLEVAEDMASTNSGLGWKIIGGALLTVGAIYGGLKLKKKIKTKKKKEEQYVETTEGERPVIVTTAVEVEEGEKNNKKNK